MRIILILILVIRELHGHPSDIVSDDSDLERLSDQELSFLSNEVDEVQSETPTLTKRVNNHFSKKRFLCFPPRVCILPVPRPQEVTTTKPMCPTTPTPTSPPNDFMNNIVLDIGPLTFILPRNKAVSWLDAYAECKYRKGYTLVSVESVEKYMTVIQAIKKSGIKSRDFWTSGTDVFNLPRNASNFVWLPTKEPVELTLPFWTRDQPDNGSKGQQCLTLSAFLNGVDFKLDDQECSRSNTFICERLQLTLNFNSFHAHPCNY